MREERERGKREGAGGVRMRIRMRIRWNYERERECKWECECEREHEHERKLKSERESEPEPEHEQIHDHEFQHSEIEEHCRYNIIRSLRSFPEERSLRIDKVLFWFPGIRAKATSPLTYPIRIIHLFFVVTHHQYTHTTYSFFSTGLPLISLPFALHGKCATGIMKKLFPVSAIPARALYHARNAANSPK